MNFSIKNNELIINASYYYVKENLTDIVHSELIKERKKIIMELNEKLQNEIQILEDIECFKTSKPHFEIQERQIGAITNITDIIQISYKKQLKNNDVNKKV